MKYHLITYGCQMNTADSEEMAQPLRDRGYFATEDIAEADIAIMNTCTVREHAEHKAYSNLGRLREWKDERPGRLLIVAGCAATLWGEGVKKKYPHIDLVSPATKIEEFPRLIEEAFKAQTAALRNVGDPEQPRSGVSVSGSTYEELLSPPHWTAASPEGRHSGPPPLMPNTLFGDSRTAFVTIMRGCNLACSYCIVPQVRGREKYRAMPDILEEVRAKAAQGFKEVMLLGQTVNSYFWRNDAETRGLGDSEPREDTASPRHRVTASTVMDFADLLRAVNQIPGVDVIRFMSPHPKHMRARTIEALRDCHKIARHVHLPLQSGSSAVLARMKRLYTREEYISIVAAMRDAMPGLQVTTDVIVGYPGETEEEFEQTLSLMKEVRFEGLFAFKYSPRPGTDSAELPDDVSELEKETRNQRILALNTAIKATTLAAAGISRSW